MTEKEKWLLERRKGIGGSDAAAILGLSPWKSAMDVWLDKMGLAGDDWPDPDREFLLALGTELEPVISRLYERETGSRLCLPFPVRIVHPEYPMLAGTPDRFVIGEERGVELKSENQFQDQFGEPGTDQVPYHYVVQCAHYMAVTGFPCWDVALLRGGAAFSIYHIERDAELERDMTDQLRAWWDRHVVGGQAPDVDGSGAWKVYLRKKFPQDILPITDADQDSMVLINNLRTVRGIVDEYTKLKDEMENRLKFLIGEHEGLRGEFGKITWKRSKDSSEIDWKAAFIALALYPGVPEKLVAETLVEATSLKPGLRRFLFTPKKGWTNGITGQQVADRIGTGTDAGHALLGDGEHGAGSAGKSAD